MSCFLNKASWRGLWTALRVLLCLAAGPVQAGNCANPTGAEGMLIYNGDYHTYQFCNGANWVTAGQIYGVPSSGVGYFVLSQSTWNGNLGGGWNAGADSKCLTELTTNTGWKGYATANSNGQLIARKVHAFLCMGQSGYYWGICGALVPNTTYYFAYAGDGTKGGASFTTDGNGLGPNDSADWSGSSYFGGNYSYWTNMSYNSDTQWSNGGHSSGGGCSSSSGATWDSSSSGDLGLYGSSGETGLNRWLFNAGASTISCNNAEHLICIVQP